MNGALKAGGRAGRTEEPNEWDSKTNEQQMCTSEVLAACAGGISDLLLHHRGDPEIDAMGVETDL